MIGRLVFIFLVSVQLGSASDLKHLNEVGPVVFANVLFRHGARTPISFYPNDPYQDMTYWPEGLGQLTNEGKMQHYELGKWLRSHYESLISEEYTPDEIYIQSTDVDRCLMSAYCNLAGLYPPQPDQRWNESLNWQPIPVHTTPSAEDKLLGMGAPCRKLSLEYNKAMSEGVIKKWNDEIEWVYDYVNNHTGYGVYDLWTLTYIYSELFIEEQHGLELPEWTKKVYPEPMRSASARGFAVHTINDPMKRLTTGPLLKDMLEHFVEKTEGRLVPDRKLWVYSAHDTQISNLLNTLDIFNYLNPPYATAIMLELRKGEQDQYYVNVLLKNETGDPYALQVPQCSLACPLYKFINLYNDLIPINWDRECQMDTYFYTGNEFGAEGEDSIKDDVVIRKIRDVARRKDIKF